MFDESFIEKIKSRLIELGAGVSYCSTFIKNELDFVCRYDRCFETEDREKEWKWLEQDLDKIENDIIVLAGDEYQVDGCLLARLIDEYAGEAHLGKMLQGFRIRIKRIKGYRNVR